jgi:L-arabinokinase
VQIAFYISGHGLGHAVRQIEIINALARQRPDAAVLIRSSAARRIFDRTVNRPFELDDRPCDTGVVQIDSLRLDAAATVARASAFYRTIGERAEAEARLLRDRGVRLVIADAPPLACAAAALAGIPSVVISNFTWDWIYQEYAEHLSSAPDLIPTIQSAYKLADEAWVLPMHGGFETFGPARDVPFVARHARTDLTRQDVLRMLSLPADRPLALVTFGGYGVDELPLARLDCLPDWTIVLTDSDEASRGHAGIAGIHVVAEERLYGAGLRYQDLVAAVDAVVTKPGYGIISECVANETALVYTSRGRFAEYPVLVREMPKYVRSAYLDRASLVAGRWRGPLDAAVSAPPPPQHPPTNGADVIAGSISSYLP